LRRKSFWLGRLQLAMLTTTKGGRAGRQSQDRGARQSQERSPARPGINRRAGRTSVESMGKKKNRGALSDDTLPGQGRKFHTLRDEAQWKVLQTWAPPRPLKEHELAECRKMFYQLDRDNSGAIDADELGAMMRTLGQDPTEEECKELIASVDNPDSPDGLIQYREFCLLYAQGVDSKDKAGCLDSLNIFCALGGDPKKPDAKVSPEIFHDSLLETFGLDVDLFETFGFTPKDGGLTQDDFKVILGTAH